ncbi:hypothetical protein BJ322DRAFT_843311 [Thelephora terrestris]|uniref:Uncharacterized protein n=1 Tax=Thelephora terrestris TaxID=56493 RepID=A0A9P6L636_9AGAM|nr:hypothetical protein BJ322DRAFT_843311 [Thelephora terrestris]
MDHSELLNSNPELLEYTIGCYPTQCHLCGREFKNMSCKSCAPYIHPIQRNRGGFSKYGQLTVGSQSGPPSPKKRSYKSKYSGKPDWKVQYERVDGGTLKLITVGPDTLASVGPFIKDGDKTPFKKRTKLDGEFNVRAQFSWLDHVWECDIPCNRESTEAAVYIRICIYFQRFIETIAKEKCSDSRECLCGSRSSSVTREDIVIFGYDVYRIDGTFTMVVRL